MDVSMIPNQQDWQSESFRASVRSQINDAVRTSHYSGRNESIECTIFQKSSNMKEYLDYANKVILRLREKTSQDQVHQQYQQPPQQQFQQQQITPGSAQNTMYRNESTNIQTTSMLPPKQPGQQVIIPQGSPGQVLQMRTAMPTSSSPISRTGLGNTVPSPQTNMMPGHARPGWSHPSPVNQFTGKQFPRRQDIQPNTQQQPALTIPDSAGTPQTSAIPSLSPAHQSPQVPTTSPSLRTPGSVQTIHSPGMLTVPSPSTSSQQPQQEDDKEYMEKLKHLQKYIEPLSRMINKFNEDEDNYIKEMSKMKALRDILMNPTKRLQMCTLDKCEKVLQNWLGHKPSKPPLLQRNPDQHMCQPFLNVIATATKSPLLNHTLKRTFEPAMATICGKYTVPDYIPNKKRCLHRAVRELECDKQKNRVPDVILGEIARLNTKYKVRLDKAHNDQDGSIRVLCTLNDPKLPSVVPLHLSVPLTYPDQSAQWIASPESPPRHGSSEHHNKIQSGDDEQDFFHKKLRAIIHDRLNRLTDSCYSMSSLITAWEMCVRQACAETA